MSAKAAAERGALSAAAGALLAAGVTVAWRPDLLARFLGPEPMPQVLALMSVAAALPAGGELGRRAIRLRATAVQRRRQLLGWTVLAYVASVAFGAAALGIAHVGPGALADPYLLVGKGLALCLMLAPAAALPVVLTALLIERFTRPPGERSTHGGPGGGPRPGTRAPALTGSLTEVGPTRRAA